MKTYFNFLIFLAASFLFLSCNNDSVKDNTGKDNAEPIPMMHSKVVSYKNIGATLQHPDAIVTDNETLKLWFPHIFDNGQANTECNYFALFFMTSSINYEYWLLSQDMVLYRVTHGKGSKCGMSEDINFHAMLVCDDTDEENLLSEIDIDDIRSYADPDWNCEKTMAKNKNLFF